MRLHFSLIVLLIAVLSACSTSDAPQGQAQVVPTSETLQGAVNITFPMSGSIIYAETIILQGTASDIPVEGFQIQLITPDDSIISEATVQADDDGSWSIEIVHEYTGDPTEVTILARPTASDSTLDYDIVSILLATLDNRPDGVFGSILSPAEGTAIGGDFMLISGRASGLFENMFALILENTEGELITEIPVSLNNPNFIDDMLWEAELPRNDFIGNGTLRIVYQDMESGDIVEMDSINIVVSSVAG